MSIGLIITLVMIAYVLLLGLFTALPARKHHWIMALVRTGIIVVSVIIAVPVSKVIAGAVSGTLAPMFDGLLSGDIGELVEHAPILKESVELMVALIIAPLVFLVLFIVIRGVLAIAALIVEKTVPYFKERNPKKGTKKDPHNTAIAMPVGAFNGILVALVTLIPLCGYIGLVSGFMSLLDMGNTQSAPESSVSVVAPSVEYLASETTADFTQQRAPAEEEDEMMATVKEVLENPMIGAVNTVGRPVFNWMTSGKVHGTTGDVDFSLSKDLPHLAQSLTGFVDAMALTEDGNMTEEDKKALLDAVDFLMESDWVAEVMAQTIGYMATQWKQGETVMGIAAPDIGDDMVQPMMNKMWDILATESKETIREDLETLTIVLSDLMSLGFATADGDNQAVITQLAGGENSTLSHMIQTLEANAHMAPLVDEIRALSLRLVSRTMGDALKNTDQYDEVISNVAEVFNDVANMPAEQRQEVLKTKVKEAFATQEIDVPEDLAVELSEKAIADLSANGEPITDEALKNYFIDHMDENVGAVGDSLPDGLPEGSVIPGGVPEDSVIPDGVN